MLSYAIFGIHTSALNLAVELVILFLVVIWFALVFWTYADARRRIADPLLVACATIASMAPYVGSIVYLIVRPPEYLDDVRERELEMQAAEARLAELGYHLCPHCDYEVERSSCAARTACASSRTPAITAVGRSTRCGRCARTARPRSASDGRGSPRAASAGAA